MDPVRKVDWLEVEDTLGRLETAGQSELCSATDPLVRLQLARSGAAPQLTKEQVRLHCALHSWCWRTSFSARSRVALRMAVHQKSRMRCDGLGLDALACLVDRQAPPAFLRSPV